MLRRTAVFVLALLLAAPLASRGDDATPPADPYAGEHVILVGLPGDDDFYELHVQADGTRYVVDEFGGAYRDERELLAGDFVR